MRIVGKETRDSSTVYAKNKTEKMSHNVRLLFYIIKIGTIMQIG